MKHRRQNTLLEALQSKKAIGLKEMLMGFIGEDRKDRIFLLQGYLGIIIIAIGQYFGWWAYLRSLI